MTSSSVGSRMAAVFDPDGDSEPKVAPEAVEPIRELLRERDYASAAKYVGMVLDSVGIEVAGAELRRPGGRPDTTTDARRSGRAEVLRTADTSSAADSKESGASRDKEI